MSLRQPSTASGQRGLNTQPLGGLIGLGTSPFSTRCSRARSISGSGTGIADKSALRVGVLRVVEQFVAVRQFDHSAEIHYRDAVAEMAHDAEVVGDEQIGQVELFAQLFQQVDDLRLDRDVERRHRLVADDEIGIERQRPGDADALTLAAAHLVRVAVRHFRVEAADREQFSDPLHALLRLSGSRPCT